jgi:hypothetical protein
MSAEAGPRPARTHWLVWIFAGVGLLGIIAIIALVAMISNLGRGYEPPKVAGAKPETVFTLGSVSELAGTNLIRIDINAQDSSRGSGSYSGVRDDTRNILLLDKTTGTSRKLLPDNGRRIEQSHFLPAKAGLVASGDDPLLGGSDSSDRPPPAYYVLILTQGEREGARDILAGTLAGGRQAYVMRGVDGVDSIWMQNPTQIGFVVRERLGLYYRIVDIPTLKVVASRRVAID